MYFWWRVKYIPAIVVYYKSRAGVYKLGMALGMALYNIISVTRRNGWTLIAVRTREQQQ